MSSMSESNGQETPRRRPRLTPQQVAAARKTKEDSQSIVDRLADRLPADHLPSLRDMLFAGEFDLLADLIGAMLSKRQIPITPDEYQAVRDLLYRFNSEHVMTHYQYIANRDEVLASLNVVDDQTA